MNAAEFFIELTKRWPGLLKADAVRDDIINHVSCFTAESRKLILETFIKTYSYSKDPRLADIYKVTKDMQQDLVRRSEGKTYKSKCKKCGLVFDFDALKCPYCMKVGPRTIHVV